MLGIVLRGIAPRMFAYLIFTVCLMASCSIQKQYQTGFKLRHNGKERSYDLYIPSDLPDGKPLVLVLHGYADSSGRFQTETAFNRVAEEEKFLVCYPQGAVDMNGHSHWNAGLEISRTDDAGFLHMLIDRLQADFKIDSRAVFMTGFSNGGFMCYAMACERPGLLAGIAPVAATMSGNTWRHCSPNAPTPVMHIHGADDETVPDDGSIERYGGWSGAPPLDEVIEYWARLNATLPPETITVSDKTSARIYLNDAKGNEVWYYRIEDFGHAWPGPLHQDSTGIVSAELIWDFFKRYADN